MSDPDERTKIYEINNLLTLEEQTLVLKALSISKEYESYLKGESTFDSLKARLKVTNP